jgi:hypothetical protein
MVGCGFSGLLLIACGSSSGTQTGTKGSGAGSISGTALGRTLQVADAIATEGTLVKGGADAGVAGTSYFAGAYLASFSNICALLQQPNHPAYANSWALYVGVEQPAPVAPGTYTLAPGTSAHFAALDATCTPAGNEQAKTGTITFETVSATELSGSFDVTLDGGDHLTGTFSAPVCNLASAAYPQPTTGCQ